MSKMNRSRAIMRSGLVAVASAATFFLAACGGGGSSPTSASGTAAFALTDAPSCGEFTSVVVTIVGVQLIGNDGTPYNLTLQTPMQQDLLQLTNGQSVNLGPISVPTGTYNQVRLVLAPTTGSGSSAPANYVTTQSGGSQQYPLTTPSAQQSGYKVNGSFTVNPDRTVNVTLDFNACRSVVTAGSSGKYLLKPVIKAVEDDTAGAITGKTTPGALVFAEDTEGHIVKTTVADASTGNFTLAPLEATDSGDAGYNVVVVPPQPASGSTTPSPNFAPDVVLNVPVTGGQSTPIPAGSLPSDPTTNQTYSGAITLATADSDVLVLAQEPVTNAVDGSTSTVTIAESLAVPDSATSGNTSSTYTLTFADAPPEVATYSASGLTFTPSASAPTITVEGFGSDGSTGLAATTAPNDITMSGSGDSTYETDN